MHKTKWVLPIMAVMWAVCLLAAPPLTDSGTAHEPMDAYVMTDQAPASAVFAVKGLDAAPVATNLEAAAVYLTNALTSASAGHGLLMTARQWREAAARVPVRPRMWSI